MVGSKSIFTIYNLQIGYNMNAHSAALHKNKLWGFLKISKGYIKGGAYLKYINILHHRFENVQSQNSV